MIFYRYEKSDGGGPYFTREGVSRINNNIYSNDDTLDGAITVKELNQWFKNKEEILKDCYIVIYDGELLHANLKTGNCIFRKSNAKRIGEIICV